MLQYTILYPFLNTHVKHIIPATSSPLMDAKQKGKMEKRKKINLIILNFY